MLLSHRYETLLWEGHAVWWSDKCLSRRWWAECVSVSSFFWVSTVSHSQAAWGTAGAYWPVFVYYYDTDYFYSLVLSQIFYLLSLSIYHCCFVSINAVFSNSDLLGSVSIFLCLSFFLTLQLSLYLPLLCLPLDTLTSTPTPLTLTVQN